MQGWKPQAPEEEPMTEVTESLGGNGATPTNCEDPSAISAAVRMALERTGHGWLRRIVVVPDGESIVLQGILPSYYLKQMAQVTVLTVPGVRALRNELVVEGGYR